MHANACEAARPFWFENNTLNEVAFCEDFLKKHPMLSVGGQFFSVDGRIHDEESIRKEIYEALRPFMTTGLAKRASSLLEMLRLKNGSIAKVERSPFARADLEHDNHISNAMGKQVNGFWGIEALIRPAAF